MKTKINFFLLSFFVFLIPTLTQAITCTAPEYGCDSGLSVCTSDTSVSGWSAAGPNATSVDCSYYCPSGYTQSCASPILELSCSPAIACYATAQCKCTAPVVASCSINSFSCDGTTLSWSTSNCSSISISSVGSVGSTGSASVSVGSHTLTADGNSSSATCVLPTPVLSVSGGGSATLSSSESTSFDFNYDNVGQDGSVLNVECKISYLLGVELKRLDCPQSTITK